MVKSYDVLKGFYDLERTIGCGGFAKVKLATHIATGEKVAIKIMEKLSLKDDLPRVQLELKALKSMSHPHICKLYQVIETESHYFIVIEYCSGGELFDHIVEKNRLSEKESRKFFKQILSAVAYLHSLGYAHRDLKPENVLLDHAQNLKLIDFGLCAKPDGGVQNPLFTSCGSPTYAAPELVLGKQYLGPEVDVWAMGILLFALLCGFLPFDDNSISALYKKILVGKYQEPHYLSQSSRRLIRLMLQVDPKKRTTVKELLVHPWVTLGSEDEIKVTTDLGKVADEDVVSLMAQYHNANSADVWKNVSKWKYDYNTATYMLLLARKNRGLPLRLLPGSLKQPIRTRSAEAISTPNSLKTPIRRALDTNMCHRLAINQMGTPKVPTLKVNDIGDVPSNKFDHDKDGLLTPKFIGISPNTILETRKPGSIRKPMKRIRSPNLDNDSSPVPTKKTPGRSASKTPELWKNNSTPVSSEISSARKVLGNIERSLNRVRHVLTPRKSSPACPSVLSNKGLCNVSTTQCSDPDYVITELIKGLQGKGIDCRRKGFAIRGKMDPKTNAQYGGGCSFELEICYLPTMGLTPSKKGSTPTGKPSYYGLTPPTRGFDTAAKKGEGGFSVHRVPQMVGIRRKRLNGDSWCYKKVCEEVLALTATELRQTSV